MAFGTSPFSPSDPPAGGGGSEAEGEFPTLVMNLPKSIFALILMREQQGGLGMNKERKMAIADDLVSAVERLDLAKVEEIFSPDIVMKYNVFDKPLGRDEALAGISRMRGMCETFAYENVERLETENGYVQTATVAGRTDSGIPFSIETCVLAEIDDAGKIVAIKEYMDSAAAKEFF